MNTPIETSELTCLGCGKHVGWCDSYGSKREPPIVRCSSCLGHRGGPFSMDHATYYIEVDGEVVPVQRGGAASVARSGLMAGA